MIVVVSLLASALFLSNVRADIPTAVSLDLNSTWSAPMPNSAVSSASDYITSNWDSARGFYGADNVEFVPDPINSNGSTTVLKVKYPAGSYAPVATKNGNGGVAGGAEFYTEPFDNTMYNTALLSYDIAFDNSFDFVKGGKLPGLYGGKVNIRSAILGHNC